MSLSEHPSLYEPWQPAIGQQVRVRISGECRFRQAFFTADESIFVDESEVVVEIEGHHPVEDGQIGVIKFIEPFDPSSRLSADTEAHRVLVEFAPFIVPGVTDRLQECGYYAVIELEAVDATSAARRR